MNLPGIAILSVALLPVALALVWLHRFTVSYRSSDFDIELQRLADDAVITQARQPAGRYIPPRAARDREYAVSVLSEAGF
jgi:hypothetical protein